MISFSGNLDKVPNLYHWNIYNEHGNKFVLLSKGHNFQSLTNDCSLLYSKVKGLAAI